VGVVLAAVFASSIIEFLLFREGAPHRTMTDYSYNGKDAAMNIAASSEAVNESLKEGLRELTEMNQTPAVPVQPVATMTSAPVQAPLMNDGSAVHSRATDLLTNIAEAVSTHPGLLFLLGCIFVIILLVTWDFYRKRK
jgi:hypothetical protein